jgi:hypothetical protein
MNKTKHGNPRFEKVFTKFNNVVEKTANLKKRSKIDISQKYDNFLAKVNKPENKKLLNKLPSILLAITILAVRNKKVLKYLYDGYDLAVRSFGNDITFLGKISIVIKSYIDLLKNIGVLESLETGLVVLSFFMDDIPAIIRNVSANPHENPVRPQLFKNIVKNANEVIFDVVEKPQIIKKQQREKVTERKEIVDLKREITSLREELKER